MPGILNILALCPQTPNGYNAGGGPARSYFILRALARRHPVHLAVLDDPAAAPLPDELAKLCASVLWPAADWRDGKQRPQRSRLGNAFAAAALILLPWRMSAKDLLTAAENNCVSRQETVSRNCASKESVAGWPHRAYGWLLLALTAVGSFLFGLRPARGIERCAMFKSMLPKIRRTFQNKPPDVVWIEHTYLFPEAFILRGLFPGASLVTNSHNVEYVLHKRIARIMKTVLARTWRCLQSLIMKRVERRGYKASTAIFCCSEHDARIIMKMAPQSRVRVVENGIDTKFYTPPVCVRTRTGRNGSEANVPTVLYTGGFGYPPNDDAVMFFYGEIFPRIREQIADCRFCIAGRQAKDRFGALASGDSGVEIVSDVPDIRPHFALAWVVVVPLRAGSGTRFKILEALSMGKAVVTTTLGAEGINGQDGVHYKIADSPSDFADAVVLFLRNAEMRRALGRQGRLLSQQRFDWDIITARAVNAFDEQLSDPTFHPSHTPKMR